MTDCVIDLETLPQQPETDIREKIAETIEPPAQMSKPETIKEWMEGTGKYVGVRDALIDEQYRKTALDGARGQICVIAWAIKDYDPQSLVATPGTASEADILSNFFDLLRMQLGKQPMPYFIGHYISGFDLTFLWQRAVINKVNPGMFLGQHGRHDKDYFDTMIAWAGYKDRISLENLCIALGIPCKTDGLKGGEIWDYWKAGKYAEVEAHGIMDVVSVREVYKRLKFRN